MEPASQPEFSSKTMTLESQLREMYGRAAYTHKTHEKMADGYVYRYRLIKNIEIALSAISTTSLVVAVLGESQIATIVGALISTMLLALTLYFKEASLGEQAQKHTAVASRLWGVRERLLGVLVDLRDGKSSDDVRKERNKINEQLEDIYKNAPRTSAKAYAAAQKALKEAEELYFSNEELDKLLPKQLRIAETSK